MDFRVIKKEERVQSNWSGGKTYELAIFPEDARYLDRDFIWRLSTADSDREESSFTKLPDYDRILMVLEGDVVLAHGDERSAHLQALDQDMFDGAVKTRCFGRLIRDYNLIYAKGAKGRMEVKTVRSKAAPIQMSAEAMDVMTSYGIFCLEGYAVISCGEESRMIHPDEQAVIHFPEGVEGDILLMGEGRCIVTECIMGRPRETGAKAGSDGKGEGGVGSAGAGGDREGGSENGETEAGAGLGPGASASSQDRPAFADYVTSLKLYFGRNRWSKIYRREGRSKVYYDRAMATALRKLETRYVAEMVWLGGLLLCMAPLLADLDPKVCLVAAVVYTLAHMFLIVPAIYMRWLPRPFSAHMKSVADLNAAERAYHNEEISEDPHFEKLMRKYRSDDENYFADETSPLYRLMKRK